MRRLLYASILAVCLSGCSPLAWLRQSSVGPSSNGQNPPVTVPQDPQNPVQTRGEVIGQGVRDASPLVPFPFNLILAAIGGGVIMASKKR